MQRRPQFPVLIPQRDNLGQLVNTPVSASKITMTAA